MTLPSPDTPLYNHPLPDIEQWLQSKGCRQDPEALNRWRVEKPTWQADLMLEVDAIIVRYLQADSSGEDIQRIFKYSLSRQDLEEAIFSGP